MFLPRINNQLAQFVSAWNRHPLRTENGLSPLQLWNRGLLSASSQLQSDIASGLSVDDDYGVDTGILGNTYCLDDEGVIVPDIEFDLNDSELDYIQAHYNPLQISDNNGVDIYMQVKEHIASL